MPLGSLVDSKGEHFPSAFLGSPLEEKHDQCKCENLIMFQNLANEEVRKLTQRLEEMTQRMEALENRLRYR